MLGVRGETERSPSITEWSYSRESRNLDCGPP